MQKKLAVLRMERRIVFLLKEQSKHSLGILRLSETSYCD
jgi:hypothetical protein